MGSNSPRVARKSCEIPGKKNRSRDTRTTCELIVIEYFPWAKPGVSHQTVILYQVGL